VGSKLLMLLLITPIVVLIWAILSFVTPKRRIKGRDKLFYDAESW
jgi:hypothetical protein